MLYLIIRVSFQYVYYLYFDVWGTMEKAVMCKILSTHNTNTTVRISIGISVYVGQKYVEIKCQLGNRGFYCRSYCLLNMFRAPLYPSSGAQEYYTVVAATV